MNYDEALGHLISYLLYEAEKTNYKLRLVSFDKNKTSHLLLLKAAEIAKIANPRIEITLDVGFFEHLFNKKLRQYKREKNRLLTTSREMLETVRKESDYPYTIWEDIYESFYRN